MKKYFKCEICGCEVPNECEGAEPNTCAECMPLDTEKMGQIKRNKCEMDKFPREAETPLKTAQNEPKTARVRFWLDGCDISFVAEAPADITLKQLLKQCDKIKPSWCACGVKSLAENENWLETEIFIDYDSVRKANKDVCCRIEGESDE